MNDKRKHKSLSVEDKVKILERLNAGETVVNLVSELGVHRSTIYKIKKAEEKIFRVKSTLETIDGNMKMKKYRGTEETILDKELYEWAKMRRDTGLPITGPILQEEALRVNERLGGKENFKASSGWLNNFKKRHLIWNRDEDEKSSGNANVSEDFKEKFNTLINITGIEPDCIYNCEETGLYWKLMPNRSSLEHLEKGAEESKKIRIRVTVMACTNASGSHKLKLFVIGTSVNPRCFKEVQHLPIIYKSQKSGRMDKGLMMDWFNETFVPEVKTKHDIDNSGKKIILIINNASYHPKQEEYHSLNDFITVMFLPPKTRSISEPLDQGIIEKFKKKYKRHFLTRILEEETTEECNNLLKSFTLLDCAYLCEAAWDDIGENDVRSSWKNLIPYESEHTIVEADENAIHSIMSRIQKFDSVTFSDTHHWLHLDDNGVDPPPLSGEGDDESSENPEDDDESDEEMQDFSDRSNKVTSKDALKSISRYIRWYENHGKKKDHQSLRVLYEFQNEVLETVLRERHTQKSSVALRGITVML